MMRHAAKFAGKKIVVTGGTGFLASHLCRVLARNCAELHVISRQPRKSDTEYWWQADLRDIPTVKRLLKDIRPDVIFHLSGHVSAVPDMHFATSTLESHVVSTVNLLTAATEQGCGRIVVTGSLTEPQCSHGEIVPSSPYAAAKWVSSVYARMFHFLYGTPVTIVRPFMTYGPMQNLHKIIPYVIVSLLTGQTPKLSSGRWVADWIYIDDVIEGLLAAGHVSSIEGSTIDLGSGVMISIHEVVDLVVKVSGSSIEPFFGALPDRPAEEIRLADVAHTYDKIGWQPVVPLEEGLSRTFAWYRQNLNESPSLIQEEIR
jgi:UDP-glucose 4-epimerase